jgi:hypothetical protein
VRKYLLFLIALASIAFGVCSPAFAQVGGLGFPGPGLGHQGGGGATFQGPGDIVAGTFFFYGQCPTTAFSGTLLDVVDNATGNTTGSRVLCSSGGVISSLVSGSACTFVTGNACSPLATTCAVACSVLSFYDVSGLTNCGNGAAACIMTQSTLADQAILNNGAKLSYTSTANTAYANTNYGFNTLNQAFTISAVYKRTTSAGFQTLFEMANGNVQLQTGDNAANTGDIVAGSALTYTATDSAYHSVQAVFNNTACNIYVDGVASSTSPGTCGTSTLANFNPFGIGLGAGGHVGQFFYIGVWNIGMSSGNASSMSTNDHTNCGC